MKINLYNFWYLIAQRPHHLSTVLLKHGCDVNVFTCRRMRGHAPNLPLYPKIHYKSLLSSRLYTLPFLGKLVSNYNETSEKQIFDDFISSKADFYIYQRPPRREPIVVGKPSGPLIYDCVDNFAGFSGADPRIDAWEATLCDRADYIWVVSRYLQEKLSRWHTKLRYVPNGVNFEHFSRAPLLAQAKENTYQKQRLIYVGAIYDWFDVRLVNEVAAILHDWDIILIGPAILPAHKRECLDKENIHMLGSRDYHELPELLSSAKVAMIPFVLNELNQGTSPIKLYEYLAAGIPVVSTSMPEVLPYVENGVVSCADSPSVFAATVIELNESKNIERCQEIARRCSWDNRFLPLLEELGCKAPYV